MKHTSTTRAARAFIGRDYGDAGYRERLVDVATRSPDPKEAEAASAKLRMLDMAGAARRWQYQGDAEDVDAFAVTRQDPLHSFSRRHRQAGIELRMHAQGLVVLTGFGGPLSEAVDGAQRTGAEELADRRRRGERAWQRALDALTPRKRGCIEDYQKAVRECILGRWSLSHACEGIGLYKDDRGRKEVRRAIEQALDAAADYLGVRA